jgi:regulator of sigma E protease
MGFLQSLFAFLFAIALLIAFHEYGHYWVARRCGVRILRFSVGFGRPLWRREYGPDRTEFVVAALPVGGYVRMLDEREGEVAPAERPRAFNTQSVGRRAAIVAAGPAFNFLFAIVAYWIIFMVGVTGLRPVIGEVVPGSPAARAGLSAGDEIVGLSGRSTPTWSALLEQLVAHAIAGRELVLDVRDAGAGERRVRVALPGLAVDDVAGGGVLEHLGVRPVRPVIPAVLGELRSGGAAARDGLQSGDRVLAAAGAPVTDWEDWVRVVRAHPETALEVEVERGGKRLRLVITPDAITTRDGKRVGQIGAAVDSDSASDGRLTARERYSVAGALVRSLDKTLETAALTLRILFKMIAGEASVKNLSGPLSIAKYAGESAGIGVIAFLSFLAIVSVSLGVLNLLPIPLLDGGHLMYYLSELVTGRPVSESIQAIGQQVGMVLLLGLMGLALYNDLMRLIGS